nr:Dynein intermediate chain [Hymenolepis microstoma]
MVEEAAPTPERKKERSLHLWSRLLREAQANAGSIHDGSGLFSRRWNLLLLGQHFAGKSTLLSALKNEQSRRGKETSASFEYNYIDFKDSESENLRRISTWSLDTDSGLEKLLQYALNSRTIWNTLVLICVSFGEPWKMKKTIEKVLELLGQYICQMDGVDFEEMQDLQNSLERHFRGYIDPVVEVTTPGLGITHRLSVTRKFSGIMKPEIDGLSEGRAQDEESEPDCAPQWNNLHPNDFQDPDYELPPLGDGAFVKKLRVPIIIVVTKSDLTEHMGKVLGFSDDTFDTIELELRQIAYKVGACLIYTSARNGTNISLLRNYLCHRLFGEEFLTSAQNVESKSIFIPSGWETQGKLDTLAESIPEGLRIFPSKPSIKQRILLCNSARGFLPPHSTHFQKEEKVIEAEEKQAFLSRMLNRLKASESGGKFECQSDSTTQDNLAPDKHTRRVLSVADIPETRRGNLARPTRESIDSCEASVLSTFFNTLLTKPGRGSRKNAHGRQSEYSLNTDSSVLRNLRWRTRFISSGDDVEDAKVVEKEESVEQSQREEEEDEDEEQERGEIQDESALHPMKDIKDQQDVREGSRGETSGDMEGSDLRIKSEEEAESAGQASISIDEEKEEAKELQELVGDFPIEQPVVEGEQQESETAQKGTPQSSEGLESAKTDITVLESEAEVRQRSPEEEEEEEEEEAVSLSVGVAGNGSNSTTTDIGTKVGVEEEAEEPKDTEPNDREESDAKAENILHVIESENLPDLTEDAKVVEKEDKQFGGTIHGIETPSNLGIHSLYGRLSEKRLC